MDADPNIDLTLTFLDPEQYVEHIKEDWVEGAKKSLIEAAKRVKKPLIVVLKPGSSAKVFEWIGQLQRACQEAGLPAYKSLETAIRAVSKLIGYHEFKIQHELATGRRSEDDDEPEHHESGKG